LGSLPLQADTYAFVGTRGGRTPQLLGHL